jgi:hypothetical protein
MTTFHAIRSGWVALLAALLVGVFSGCASLFIDPFIPNYASVIVSAGGLDYGIRSAEIRCQGNIYKVGAIAAHKQSPPIKFDVPSGGKVDVRIILQTGKILDGSILIGNGDVFRLDCSSSTFGVCYIRRSMF